MSSTTVPNPYNVDGILTSSSSPKCDFYDVPLSSIELSDSPICTHLDEDETATAEFLAQLETNLLYLPFYEVYEYYHKSSTLVELKYCINEYLEDLQLCIIDYDSDLPVTTYLDMGVLELPYNQFDLASYGDTFWLLLMTLCPDDGPESEFRSYSTIIYHYLRMFPHDLACARTDLLRCFEKIKKSNALGQSDRSILIEAFRKPTQRNYSTLEDFVDGISLPTERTRLYELFRTIFERYFVTNEGKSLLCLTPIGCDPATGRNIDCNDVHFHLSISTISESVQIESSTIALLAKLVIRLFRLEFGLTGTYDCSNNDCWKVVEFDIGEIAHGHSGEYGGKLRICLNSTFAKDRRLLNFYVHSDTRFVPFTLLLRNWFYRGQLLNPTDQLDETFIWLVILFLQQTDPPVLPSMQQLDDSGAFDLDPSLELNEFFSSSTNRQSIPSLINDFVQFYLHFDFEHQIFNLWDGTVCSKDQLDSTESPLAIGTTFDWNIVGTCYTVQDIEQWKIGLGKLEMLSKDGEIECEHLWNPRYFANSRSMSYQFEESEASESAQPAPQTSTPTNPLMSTFDLKQVKSKIGALQFSDRLSRLCDVNSPSDLCPFYNDFIYTEEPMHSILSTFSKDLLIFHIADIVRFFTHLHTRLQERPNLSYPTLLDSHVLNYRGYVDYCTFGPRFWQFLLECGHFSEANLLCCSNLICHYLKRIPENVLKVREQILRIHVDLVNDPMLVESEVIDCHNVEVRQNGGKVDLSSLRIFDLSSTQHRIDYILDQMYSPSKTERFGQLISKLFEHPKLLPLKVRLTKLDTDLFCNFLYSFEFKLSFESLRNVDTLLDWSTMALMLHLIGRMIKLCYNLDDGHLEMPNILCYDLASVLCPQTASCDKLKRLRIHLDQRVEQVVHLLQYWVECNGLSNSGAYLWLIVFALQNTTPPVVVLDSSQSTTTNRQTIPELIVHFFQFYSNFDFAKHVISIRDGHDYSKAIYKKFNQIKHLTSKSNVAWLEDPFTRDFIPYDTEPGEVKQFDRFKNLCNRMLSVGKISPDNCFAVLTNPVINNDGLGRRPRGISFAR